MGADGVAAASASPGPPDAVGVVDCVDAGTVAWATAPAGPAWPDRTGCAAIRPTASAMPVTEKASIVLRSLRFMMNVLLWWVGVVFNYNTKTGVCKGFAE